MSETQDHGRFVWYDLMTTDTQAAQPFYQDVVGWTTEPVANSAMPYTLWIGSQGPIGGIMALPEEAAKTGAPPQWMANVTVDDLDAAIGKVKQLGGQIYHGPAEIPNIGRFAVIADPQGASITMFKPIDTMAGHDVSRPGEFSWNELATSDDEAALKFYGELFGWEKIDTIESETGRYLVYGRDGKPLGGIFNKPPMLPVSMWLYYVHVSDLDAAIARAKAGGGKLIHGPMTVGGGDRIAQLSDPQGALFALHQTVAKA